ncbi:MAG: hypothetical protein ACTH4Y_11640 [Microbacterium gubbeenense]|uniref:hypothetical protein n=1 Tax=Microbacterium gubbeenense TaxID=159896 RepID=UPI003F9DC174
MPELKPPFIAPRSQRLRANGPYLLIHEYSLPNAYGDWETHHVAPQFDTYRDAIAAFRALCKSDARGILTLRDNRDRILARRIAHYHA